MAKKRKQRRNPVQQLDFPQELELSIGRGGALNFESELQKRAAWFAHREYMLEEGFGNRNDHPGNRPEAWWVYEAKQEKPAGEEWEDLAEMGEMDHTEMAALLAQWTKLLELREEYLRMSYHHYLEGFTPHNAPDWPELRRKYERQAALLGDVAIKGWASVLSRIMGVKKNEPC